MLLFLDIDGTLLPFGAAGPYPEYEPSALLHWKTRPLLVRRAAGLAGHHGDLRPALGGQWRVRGVSDVTRVSFSGLRT